MNKYFRLSTLMCGIMVLMASCQRDPDFRIQPEGDFIPINVSSSINQKQTKATANGFVGGDAVGLFAVNYTKNNAQAGTLAVEGNQADNVKYVFDDGKQKWAPVKSVYYKDINTHADLYLYYPYQKEINDITESNFEVQKDQSREATANKLSGYEASDFLWGKGEDITPSQSAVQIPLSHRLSAVEVKLEEGTGFETDEFANLEKSIILTNTTRKATIDYATGIVTPLGNPQLDGIVMCPQNDGSWRAIVIPQTVAASSQLFAITVNGVSYKFSQGENVTYQAGKQMNVEITVNKKTPAGDLEFSLANAQISDWIEDKNTHGGEARQYFVVTVTEPGTLGATIKAMGKNPNKIKNLKVVGTVRDDDFYFMRDSMAILEAVNMKESVVVAPKTTKTLAAFNPPYSYYSALGEPDEIGNGYAVWIDKGNNIPNNAFKDKKTLRFFTFPENINVIGANAFSGTKLSGALIVPDEVKVIFAGAFSSTNIASVSMPSDLNYLGNSAFSGCSSLSGNLILPSKLIYIGEKAFYGCEFTGELHLPDNLEYIGSYSFYEAGNFVGGLRIPDRVTIIYKSSFDNSGFTGTLDLNNVSTIQGYAFNYCKFNGDLVIPEGVNIIEEFAFYQANFSSVKFPSTLKEINRDAFGGNSFNCDIVLPEGLQVIGEDAFRHCNNITSIEFPSTIQTIQGAAFFDCFYISHIVCKASEPPTVFSKAFDGVAKDNFTLEVPASAVTRYETEPGWCEFKRIAAHYDFSLNRRKIRALNAEQSRTYVLRAPSNFSWSIESKPEWVTVTPSSGTGKDSVIVTVSAMPRTSETFEVNEGSYNNSIYKNYKGRSGEIVFKLDDKDYTFSLEIEQYDSDYADGQVVTLQTAVGHKGIDIIFVGEGYDAKDIEDGTFISNAREGYEAFFDLEPYKAYKDYFNVYAVITQSAESGIGTVNTIVDDKFGTYFSHERIMVPESEPIFSWAKKADSGVDFTKALVINLMNTSTYEGVTAMYSDGSAIAFCPVSRDAFPYDFRGIVQHEAGGHGFGKLGDEYIYHNAFIQNCDCSCCDDHPQSDNDLKSTYGKFKSLGWYKNLSMNGDMRQVPWAHLIYNPQYSDYVDMYEGGYMHSRGMFRSEATSCMNNNIPHYSAISRQAIVERIMELSDEEFTLEKFFANDKNTTGTITKAASKGLDTTYGVDPKWNRGSEEGSVIYMGEHPDYSKIK